MSKLTFKLSDLAETIGAEVIGNGDLEVTGLATIQDAEPGQLTFLANPSYKHFLKDTQATAVILNPSAAKECPVPALVLDNPYLGFAHISKLFDTAPKWEAGIHPTAVVEATAKIDSSAYIGANTYIGNHVQIAEGAFIGAGSTIEEGAVIGRQTRINANVTIYHQVVIGDECILHSGVVVGADGFGFAPAEGRWTKIHQIGSVQIGDRVEVGANTTIDRGAIGDTKIASGVKLDNQIQIAHNVEIGESTAVAACTAIAGSTKIGKNCTLAGCAGIVGHIEICDGVHVTGMTMISKSITEPGSYSSGTGQAPTGEWRKSAARFRGLDDLAKRIKVIEKQVKDLS